MEFGPVRVRISDGVHPGAPAHMVALTGRTFGREPGE